MMTSRLARCSVSCLRYVASLALLAWLVAGLGPAAAVQAAEIDVGCDVHELIAAIHAANGTPEADTLNLAAGCTYALTAMDNDTYGPNGLPVINSDLTINGNGATVERSDAPGTPEFRILTVDYPAGLVTLDRLAIRNGNVGDGEGGGIRVVYTRLSLTHCMVTGNTARRGGGILGEGQSDTILTDSTVSGNSGGGISLDESGVTLIDSTVSDNSGRGILNYAGWATLTNSTVNGNSGPGIQSDGGRATLTNSTVSGNGGRGISNNGRTTTLNNCTVSDNTGAGVYNLQGTVDLRNTIVAAQLAGSDCAGEDAVTSLGHNLDSDGTCVADGVNGDMTDPNPLLGPLQANGGPTETQALLRGSPAIDAGDDSACPATDQRGLPRPQDGDGDGTATCDIGAYELEDETDIELLSFTATAGIGQITLAWETDSEVDTAGFYLWRSETISGTYARITGSLIPAEGGGPGASYTYVDDGLEPGETYYYQLEDVTTAGKGTLHGPVWATVERGRSLYLPIMVR